MVVKRLIEKTEDDIEKLIQKGSFVKEDIKQKEQKKYTHINLRIPCDMLFKVDEALNERVGISRNGWVLESIHEKLRR